MNFDKTRVKLFPNFTRHHLITHTNNRKTTGHFVISFCSACGEKLDTAGRVYPIITKSVNVTDFL